MRPKCKAEAKWKYWREENPKPKRDRFSQWAKRMMRKSRRRFQNNPKNFDE